MTNNNKGFTLIELIVVIFLISLITMITYPKISILIEKVKFKNIVNEVVYDLIDARSRAISEGKKYRLNFYPNDNRYMIIETGYRLLCIKDKYLNEYTDMTSVSFPKGEFYYNPTGAASPVGAINLSYKNRYKARITIIIATGKVKVYYE